MSVSLTPSQVVPFAENAAQQGKIVVISALSGTFEQKPFNSVLELVPKAEKIKQLHAICKICYHMASYSLRIAKLDAGDELIGSSDMYMPVCRECYVFKTKQMQDKKAQLEGKNLLTEIRFTNDDDEKLISIEKSGESKQTDESATK